MYILVLCNTMYKLASLPKTLMDEHSISDTSPKAYIILDEVQVCCLHITISILLLLLYQNYKSIDPAAVDHPCMPIIQLYNRVVIRH